MVASACLAWATIGVHAHASRQATHTLSRPILPVIMLHTRQPYQWGPNAGQA